MTQEDYKITDENKIAWCAICTLATVMKDCKNCPFNIGLKYKEEKKEEKDG